MQGKKRSAYVDNAAVVTDRSAGKVLTKRFNGVRGCGIFMWSIYGLSYRSINVNI